MVRELIERVVAGSLKKTADDFRRTIEVLRSSFEYEETLQEIENLEEDLLSRDDSRSMVWEILDQLKEILKNPYYVLH